MPRFGSIQGCLLADASHVFKLFISVVADYFAFFGPFSLFHEIGYLKSAVMHIQGMLM